jgi:hypothetical protein
VLSEENSQRFIRVLYPVGLLLICVPLADLVLRVAPPQFGTLQWRFATAGLLLGNYGTVILGTALTGLAAALTGDRRALRAVGIGAMAMAVVTLALIVLFGLDAVQIRQVANPAIKRNILTSSLGALFTGMFGAVVWLAIARSALMASRVVARPVSRSRAAAPLVATATSGASEAV